MPKNVDPFEKKHDNRWGTKGARKKKAETVQSPQEKAIEKAKEIAKKKNQK
ncbi:MAG: DUF2188 domain-containing protein [Methanococcaceae archaeon]